MDPIRCPPRLAVPRPGVANPDGTLLVMAAARDGGCALVKVVSVGDGPLSSHVTLLSADGSLRATFDGEALTRRRTASASVLAASLLARPDASTLGVIGAGPQAAALARAYLDVFDFARVLVWARRRDRAEQFVRDLRTDTVAHVSVAGDVAEAVRSADVVTVATRASEPLVLLQDVRPGAHVDLVGGFRPDMREADDALFGRAIVVADCAQALNEAGDLLSPISAQVIREGDVRLLADLIGRRFDRSATDVTVYKSVGFAALDLVAAEVALERLDGARSGLAPRST